MAVATDKGTITIEGWDLTITNPDKPLWPGLPTRYSSTKPTHPPQSEEPPITKLEYLQRLIRLSPYLLEYCRNRYLTTIRFPHGVGDKSFYQKNCPEPAPPFVRTAELNGVNYVNLDSLPTLVWLANLACLEFHPSFHYIGETLPAEWIIDIDPSAEEEPRIMEAAHIVGELLKSLGIASIPKTSGATGIQIFIPIRKGYTFDQLRGIGLFLGEYLVQKHPKLFTIERLKKNRGTLIYFDYLQHYYGKTLSAPYTTRARPGAPVSTPLTWDEVRRNPHPSEFNLRNIDERLGRTGDLLKTVSPQSLEHVLSAVK